MKIHVIFRSWWF